MATAGLGGGAAAYQRLQVPKNSLGAVISEVGQQAAKRGQGLRDDNVELQDKIATKTDDFNKSLEAEKGAFDAVITGQDTVDDVNRNYVTKATNKYTNVGEQARELWSQGKYNEARALQVQQKKILQTFDNHNKLSEQVGESVAKVKEMLENNTLSPVDGEYPQLYQAILGNDYIVDLDDDNNPIITWKQVNEETGEEVMMTKKASEIYSNSYDAYQTVNIDDKGGILDTLKTQLGVLQLDESTGNYISTEKGWTKEAKASLEPRIKGILADPEKMSYVLYQASQGEIKKKGKPETYGEQHEFTEEDYKKATEYLKTKALGVEDRENSLKYTGADEKAKHNRAMEAVAREKAKPKPNKEDEELGVRAWNIEQVRDNDDVSFFSAGDFEWNGEEMEAVDSKMVGDKVVIKTRKGKIVTVPKTNETAMNDLFNAFEGTKTKFDDVQTVDKVAWREERQGELTDITNALNKQYSPNGEFIGDDDDFAKSLSRIYPNAEISTPWNIGEVVTVNGVDIDLNDSRENVDKAVLKALGINNNKQRKNASNGGASKFNKK